MKKFLGLLLPLALILSLAACGGPVVSATGPDDGDKKNQTDVLDNDVDRQDSGESDKDLSVDGTDKPASDSTGSASKPSDSSSSSGTTNKPSGSGSNTGSASKPSDTGTSDNSKTSHSHSYTTQVVKPTCTADGYTLHTCSCGESYKDNATSALGHNYSKKVVAATCTVGGYTLHTCSRCGTSYKDNYTDPLPKPEVYLDCAAAEAYGNQYALSLFHHVDYNLKDGNAGYFPSSVCDRKTLVAWGGQSALNNEVRVQVDITYRSLLARGDTAEDLKQYAGIRCEVVYTASRDEYTITVYYG